MSFYQKSMKHASVILFCVSLVVAIGTLISVLSNNWDMVSSGVGDVYQAHGPTAFFQILIAFVSSISAAIWPFFGAAILWLLDDRLSKSEAAE